MARTPQCTPEIQSGAPAPDMQGAIEKRIERLEERLDETIGAETSTTISRTETLIDRSQAEDALKRAVSKSNRKRGSRKA